MDKLDFITRQLKKAQNKRYEHYVVNRIWTLLNDSRIKFVTQQFVSRPEGRAMTDMFFPQLGIHIEVDEGFHKKQIDADNLREADIVNATGHEVLRVDVTNGEEQINRDIDEIVAKIKDKVASDEDFKAWDIEAEMNPQTYINKGYIDLDDNVAFRTMVDAVNCFGLNVKPKGIWTGAAKHPIEADTVIWMPKLYENKDWNNEISEDEEMITEINESQEKAEQHIDEIKAGGQFTRIVFPRYKDSLGVFMYRFKGKYKIDLEATNYENGLVWRRIATRVNTYSYVEKDDMTVSATALSNNIEEFYRNNVRSMSVADQLKLASLILVELSQGREGMGQSE